MTAEPFSITEARDAADAAAVVAAAFEVGIFSALAAGPATPEAVAAKLDLSPRAAGIVLPALTELGFAAEAGGGRFTLTERARRELADPASPDYAGGGLPHWLRNLRAWTELPDALRSGGPPADVPRERDERTTANFMAAMAAAPAERIERVVSLCLARLPGARSILDLGGGPGHMARAFVDRGLAATLFDTPGVIAHVRKAYGLDEIERLRLAPGDFLEDPLPGGPFDIVLLSNIVHIYPPDRNRQLLRKAAAVTAPGGIAAIADFVRGRSRRAARFALLMLLRTEGGNTYGEDELGAWLEEAGYGDVRVDDLDPDRQLVTAVRTT